MDYEQYRYPPGDANSDREQPRVVERSGQTATRSRDSGELAHALREMAAMLSIQHPHHDALIESARTLERMNGHVAEANERQQDAERHAAEVSGKLKLIGMVLNSVSINRD